MTTLLVASNGGHLAQLFSLAGRLDGLDPDRLWVSFDCEQARTLLRGERTVFVPYIKERDLPGVVRTVGLARRIMREAGEVGAVVSTGSAIALAFLPYAVARGIEAHYIESAARVQRPSMTGRVLQHLPGIRLYRQYPTAVNGAWRYGGSVFDGFRASAGRSGGVRRVVVTVGTDKGFRRLVEAAAAILPRDVDVLWQTGHTPVDDLGIEARPFVPAGELDRAMRDADVVIAHAGCGSALAALKAGKYPVLVPRDPRHGEVVDTHQLEIARWLERRDLALWREPEALDLDAVERAAVRTVEPLDDLPPFQLTRRR
jgi:UDP-N-acetylglucosamine--N-acetylmuramyl-(pentapeptide) pyrophosphoryl-undecaprenol N-acetylglucosamine transferase